MGQIEPLLAKAKRSQDEEDYLTLLSLLIEQYEAATEPDMELRGVALIKGLMQEMGLRQRDLVPIFKTDSIVSAVLNGHRRLTAEHINHLAAFLNYPTTCSSQEIRPGQPFKAGAHKLPKA